MAAVALPNQPCAGLGSLLGLVGAFHAHIVLFRLPDLLMDFSQRRISGGVPHRMGQLGRRFFLILQHQFGCYFSGIRVHSRLFDLFFRDFGLRFIRFGGGLFRLADGLFQSGVRSFFLREMQAWFFIHTIPPA